MGPCVMIILMRSIWLKSERSPSCFRNLREIVQSARQNIEWMKHRDHRSTGELQWDGTSANILGSNADDGTDGCVPQL
jgi:hypothetical protein